MPLRFLRRLISKQVVDKESGDSLLPPAALQEFVGGDYERVGQEFARYLREYCSLEPSGAVLDIGCGSGRIAVPLTVYLNPDATYRGFDVSPKAIEWCTRNISSRFSNFEFRVADIENGPYNPKGKHKPANFKFPYADATFDVVLLASVFTHMFPADIKHYIDEIFRVLKPSGRCLSTFFLLNEESIALTDLKKGKLNFEHRGDGYRTIQAECPEEGMAYDENFILSLWAERGMQLAGPVRYGSWCGRSQFVSFQDLLVTQKT